MPDFTNQESFSLSMHQPKAKEMSQDGWEEYAIHDGYSLMKRETLKGTSSITQYRKVRIDK